MMMQQILTVTALTFCYLADIGLQLKLAAKLNINFHISCHTSW